MVLRIAPPASSCSRSESASSSPAASPISRWTGPPARCCRSC